MGERVQRIRDPSQLGALKAWRLMPSRRYGSIVIETEVLSPEKKRWWEAQLGQLQTACGCEQGAFGLVAGVGAYLLYLLSRSGGWGDPGRRELWIGLGVAAATTSAGKLAGLLMARHKLERVIVDIQSEWNSRRGPDLVAAQAQASRPQNRVWPTRCCGGGGAALLS